MPTAFVYGIIDTSLTTGALSFDELLPARAIRVRRRLRVSPRWLPVFLLLLLGAMDCKTPTPASLEGAWAMEPGSLHKLPYPLRNADPRIVLDPSGDFVAYDVPGLLYFPGRHPLQLDAGSGRWTLLNRTGDRAVRLDFLRIVNWDDDSPYSVRLDLSGNTMTYSFGDDGKKLVLQKM
jgi:hypothetical protein